MGNLREALYAARKKYRACAVIHTRYRGYECVDITEEAFVARPIFILTDNPHNGGVLHALDPDAGRAMADMLYEAIGGKDYIERKSGQAKNFKPLKFLVKDNPEAMERYFPEDGKTSKIKIKPKPRIAKK